MLYADASGTSELDSSGEDLYVLAGLCLHESGWHDIEERFDELKGEFAFPGIPMELHALAFCCSISEQDRIEGFNELDREARREAVRAVQQLKLDHASAGERESLLRKFKRVNPFVHLTRAERSHLFERALDIIGEIDGIRLFAEIVDKPYLMSRPELVTTDSSEAVIKHAFEQLVSRFDAFLTVDNGRLRRTSVKNYGIFVMDEEKKSESFISRLLKTFQNDGHTWGSVNFVIETPFFVDSKKAISVQVIDLVAYALRRYVRKSAKAGSHEERNFMRIYHKFDRAGARLHGLRHYCARNLCNCRICLDRGHGVPAVTEMQATEHDVP